MLNNISNFFNLFKTKKIKKNLAPNDIIPIGVRDTTNRANYQASGITYKDLAAQIAPPSVNIYNSNGTLTGNRTVNCAGNELVMINSSGYIYNGNGFSIAASSGSFSMISGGFSTGMIYRLQNSIVGGPLLTLGKYQGAGVLLNLKFDHIQNVAGFSDGRTDQAFTYNGLKVNIANRLYQFGQITGSNTTNITIDDAATFPVQINGVNVTQNTAGVASGVNLKIKVNGVDYVIELKQPA